MEYHDRLKKSVSFREDSKQSGPKYFYRLSDVLSRIINLYSTKNINTIKLTINKSNGKIVSVENNALDLINDIIKIIKKHDNENIRGFKLEFKKE